MTTLGRHGWPVGIHTIRTAITSSGEGARARASVDYSSWSCLALLCSAAATRFRIVSVPAPAPLTGVAVGGDGSVWAVDPYRVCLGRKGSKHCRPPLLISYDPASGRFQRFAIPRRGGFKERGSQYLSTPMTASPGGSIWIDLQSGKGYVLMRFRDGHFTTYRRWRGLEPLIVGASGNLWLTGRHGHPLVFSPSTGRTYKLREHGGKLFQSPDGQISYVWSPSPAR